MIRLLRRKRLMCSDIKKISQNKKLEKVEDSIVLQLFSVIGTEDNWRILWRLIFRRS